MSELVVRVGSRSAQGLRSKNEDRFVADEGRNVYLVADGMGGQEKGERASGMAAEIIPRVVEECLANHAAPDKAVQTALARANEAIIREGQDMPLGRRMGTTAVVAVQRDDCVYVTNWGDSRAYLVRDGRVEQLTIDHTIAEALHRNGTLTAEEAKTSPFRNRLYAFLGCAELKDDAQVRPFTPQAGDRLVLASDGLTNHVTDADLLAGTDQFTDPNEWADRLVTLALERGSTDNVTCVVLAFEKE